MTHPLQHIREQIVREFDDRFTDKLWKFIDREMTEQQRQVLFGKDSEYFGALRVFILSALTRYEEALVGEIEFQKVIAQIAALEAMVRHGKKGDMEKAIERLYEKADTLKAKLTSKGCCEKCSGFISTQIKGGKIESSLYCRDANCRCHTTNK